MAMLDYGINVKINGEFVNKDMGDTAKYMDFSRFPAGLDAGFKDSYLVYLGNKKLMLAFHKNTMCILVDGVVTDTFSGTEDIKEFSGYRKIAVNDKESITITRLDRFRPETGRFYAEWTHNKKHYEVVFGYGVTNVSSCFSETLTQYQYTKVEKQRLTRWFI